MEINIYVQKFSRLIRKIIDERYDLSRYHREQLLRHLDDDNDSAAKILLGTPMFSDLIFHSIENLRSFSVENKMFILEVLTILFRNEMQFHRVQNQGLRLNLLKEYTRDNMETKYPSPELHHAAVNLVISQVSHMTGLKLLVDCKAWESVMCPGPHMKPAYVRNAIYKFMSELVWRLDYFEEEATLTEVLEYIMLPIKSSAYITLTIFDADNEHVISEPIVTPLNILLTIVSHTSRMIASKIFVRIFKMMYFIDAPLHKVYTGTRDHIIITLTNDIAFELYFAMAAKAMSREGKTESDLLNETVVNFLNLLTKTLVKKRAVPASMDFITKANLFWRKKGSALYSSTFERNGKKYNIETQFAALLITPLLAYSIKSYKQADKAIEKYNVRLGGKITEHIVKSCYLYRDILETGDWRHYTIMATKEILKLKGLIKATQAGFVFQSLYYVLEMYVVTDDEDRVTDLISVKSSEDVKLLSLVLDAMKMLLLEHNINWYENVEIISLQNGLTYLLKLKHNPLPNKLLQQALDLVELSVRRFLSPDMTLLIESKRGSTLDEVAAVMKAYIEHEEWEVRDSAFSLLHSCTDIAFVKYMPLQKLISENGLMLQAARAVFLDSESYVQATALRCLAAATRIESLWQQVLFANRNLYKDLICLLRNSDEAMIRREMINVLTQVYVNLKTTPQFQTCMYNIMTTAAVDDLHFEVQTTALLFWKHVIKKHFQNKGMIDGKFPKVTFSKEKRKIIVLNEMEIKKQLTSILNDLSDIGCLTVLHHCLNEDLNLNVTSQAYNMTKELIDIFDFHRLDKVLENNVPQSMDEQMEDIKDIDVDMVLDLSLTIDKEARREHVINDILDTKTADLIMNLGEKHIDHSLNEENIPIEPSNRLKIHPNKFLDDFKRTDYASLIKTKHSWKIDSPSLNQILDEILET